MNASRIGVVVVHWQGMVDVLDCLASLAQLDLEADVVVVTNGPADFDEPMARAVHPDFTLIASATNRGYAGGCNLGAAELLSRGADFVMFLNDDAVVPPDVFAPIVRAFAAHADAGIAGPVIVYHDDPGRVWFAGGRLYRWLGYTRHVGFGARAMPSQVRRVDFMNGCALVARREVLEQTGGFDETYFHYFEDADLCERARAMGWATLVVPGPPVQHRVSASSGGAGPRGLNAWQAYQMARNRLLFVRRNLHGLQRATALLSQLLVLLPYELLKFARRGNWSGAGGQLSGVLDGLLGRDGPRRDPAALAPTPATTHRTA